MQAKRWMSRRRALALLSGATLAGILPACESGGHFTLLGYTTRPNYDCSIKTIHVPIFKNLTLGAFRQGLEFDLTRAVIREIEAKTPYKVVSHGNADTELTGTIKGVVKNVLLMNQLNEVREAETILTVDVVWRDLRSGRILSRPPRRPGEPLPVEALADPALAARTGTVVPPMSTSAPTFPTTPVVAAEGEAIGPAIVTPDPLAPTPPPPPTTLTSRGNFIPELGQSITSSLQANVDRMATQIVNMMEKPW